MMNATTALTGLLLLGLTTAASAQERQTVTIPRVPADVRVDGVLDEPVWQQAAVLKDFHQFEPVDSRPAEERTEVLVWYAPDAIYFGIRAFDSQPGTVRATRADRDNIGNDDQVTIYLDTFNDRRRSFFFSVNPMGVQGDGIRTEGAATATRMFGGEVDNSPDFIFQSHGEVTADGYVVEVRIPFKSLRFAGSGPQQWGLQIERKVQRTGYTDTWTDVRRASASFLLQAGTVAGLHDLVRGVVLEAQPFVTASAPGSFESDRFERGDIEPNAGANVRVAFTNTVLDATINPDFSQVESDAGQVTINERFALFFPEKRPFFLEGIDLFSTPSQLVYTRRVVDPIAGGKLTGKFGKMGVAHLTAVDQNVDADGREALFNITRLRRDFGTNSVMGLTYTDRTVLDGDGHNRVLSGDARIVFRKLYYVEGQWAGSRTQRAGGDELTSALWKLEYDRTGRQWGFNYNLNGVGESFRADAGFVNRPGVVTGRAMNRFSLYGRPGAFVEQASVFLGPSRVWDYATFGSDGAIEGEENANFRFTLRGGWSANLSGGRKFYQLFSEDYAGLSDAAGTPYVPLSQVSGPQVNLQVGTPTYRRFNAQVAVGTGRVPIFDEGARGNGYTASAELALRPTDQVRLALTTAYRLLDRAGDNSEFARSIIPRLKAEFQATRSLFFRAITEYRAERVAGLRDVRTGLPLYRNGELSAPGTNDGVRVDLLASYEPSPGTVAYLGYGSSLVESPFERNTFRRSNDGFFFKLAYQFRR